MKSVRENTQKRRAQAAPAPAPPPAGPSEADAWTYEAAQGEGAGDLAPVVGKNLRTLRTQRGLSLEALAKRSGVSRAIRLMDVASPTATIRPSA